MRNNILILAAAFALAACSTTPTKPPAADASEGPCTSPAHNALDFWLGEWAVSWTGQNGDTRTGSNRIDRDSYAGCVITERFDGRPGLGLQGMSVSVYDVAAKTWRQTWVDNQGGYIALAGGPKADGSFVLQTARVSGRPRFRMTWTNITADSLTWRWQRQQEGSADWEDRWVLYYTRR